MLSFHGSKARRFPATDRAFSIVARARPTFFASEGVDQLASDTMTAIWKGVDESKSSYLHKTC